MYTPTQFKVESIKEQIEFIRKNPFALIITVDGDTPITSHIPLICEETDHGLLLQGHFAKANPHSKIFDGKQIKVIFNGPHGYISPSWYEDSNEVPTWNYMAVHCTGTGRVFDDPEWLNNCLEKLVLENEPTGVSEAWVFDADQPHVKNQLKGIVGFEIEVSKIEAKYKLSQNRSVQDQKNVIEALEKISNDDSVAMAIQMKKAHPEG